MLLKYYKECDNFGDALNPYIFNNFLPGYFGKNKDEDIDFFGIGSIIGFDIMTLSKAKRKIIFSSGLAYSKPPKIDNTYDIFCVRGPLTAKKMGLGKEYAITDGAVLIREVFKENHTKKYDCSFMPHHRSAEMFNWESLCTSLNIKYINPCGDYLNNLRIINQSNLVISEAMHGAIVSDALRVPWVPVKIYKHINEFKWKDWMYSLNMDHSLIKLPRIFTKNTIENRVNKNVFGQFLRQEKIDKITKGISWYQEKYLIRQVEDTLKTLSKMSGYISDEDTLMKKTNQLLEKIEILKEKYQ